jgi:GNAT superfamily N-acetyltransferase
VSLVVRRVDVGDELVRVAVDTLIAECFKPTDFRSDQLPRAKTGYWWVAFDGKTPVAFANLRPSIRSPDTGYLSMAGVLPKWRGKGLQRRMIKARVVFARELGWHTVITDTINDNAASMRSLISCGFKPFLPQVLWGDGHAVYWTRSTEPKLSA